jgi:hypothetical protein
MVCVSRFEPLLDISAAEAAAQASRQRADEINTRDQPNLCSTT